MRKSEARLSLRQKALFCCTGMALLDTLYRHGRFALLETQLRSPVFGPLRSPYRIEQCCACTVLLSFERFLRDEGRAGAAQPFVCRTCLLTALGH
jgi:hypothetical protein